MSSPTEASNNPPVANDPAMEGGPEPIFSLTARLPTHTSNIVQQMYQSIRQAKAEIVESKKQLKLLSIEIVVLYGIIQWLNDLDRRMHDFRQYAKIGGRFDFIMRGNF